MTVAEATGAAAWRLRLGAAVSSSSVATGWDFHNKSRNLRLFEKCYVFPTNCLWQDFSWTRCTYLKYCPAGGISEAGSLATDHMTTEGWFLSRRTSSSMTSKWWFREAVPKLRLWGETKSIVFIVHVCSLNKHFFLIKCCTELTEFRPSVFWLHVCDFSGWLTHTHRVTKFNTTNRLRFLLSFKLNNKFCF